MILYLLRGVFVLVAAAVTALYLLSNQISVGVPFGWFVFIMFVAVGVTGLVVGFDVSNPNKKLSSVSGIFLGLIAGMIAAYALSFVVDFIALISIADLPFDHPATPLDYNQLTDAQRRILTSRDAYLNLFEGVKIIIGLITCYIGISLVIQTKDDFRFVVPYVEFAKQIRGNRPTLLDTSVIIDGRILDVIETRVIQGILVVPKFVLNELQTVADSADKLKRARGRRGLDVLQKLQETSHIEVLIEDQEAEGSNVDQKLIALAKDTQARVMTNDYNLNKIAQLRGVEVINLNDVAKAMRPVVLPGEHMNVKLVKSGENPTQGVGYLDDGTMVVVEGGRDHLEQHVDLVVTSTLQTSAGRMIFGRFADEVEDADPPATAPTPKTSSASTHPPREDRSSSRRNPRRS